MGFQTLSQFTLSKYQRGYWSVKGAGSKEKYFLILRIFYIGGSVDRHTTTTLSLSFPLSTTSFVGSLHHQQGLSTPCRVENVPLSALFETETPDAQRGGRQGAQSVRPSHFFFFCYHTGDRIPFISGAAAS